MRKAAHNNPTQKAGIRGEILYTFANLQTLTIKI
jgi:hypothetical protein